MKELKKMNIATIALLALAVLALVGIAIVDRTGYSLRDSSSLTGVQITVPAVNATAAVGTTGQYPFLQTVTSCLNASNGSLSYSSSFYTVQEGTSDGGTILNLDAGSGWAAATVNCSISYLASNSVSSTATLFNAGLVVFATFCGLIALVLVGKLLIGLIKQQKGD